jgi:hypothetical protein
MQVLGHADIIHHDGPRVFDLNHAYPRGGRGGSRRISPSCRSFCGKLARLTARALVPHPFLIRIKVSRPSNGVLIAPIMLKGHVKGLAERGEDILTFGAPQATSVASRRINRRRNEVHTLTCCCRYPGPRSNR